MPGLKRTHDFDDATNRLPRDYDPEDDPSDFSASEDGSDLDLADVNGGREHYEPVGKSKLRSKDPARLGPQYAGSRVGRAGFDDSEDEHDPFAEAQSDDEGDGDNEGDGNDESDVDGALEYDDEDIVTSADEDGVDNDGTDATSMSGDTEDDEDAEGSMLEDDDDDEEEMDDRRQAPKVDRAALRNLMNDEQRSVTSALSAASKADAEKGRAIKRQRTTYDGLLNTRIRLQQGVGAVNTLGNGGEGKKYENAYKGAEEAAIQLWNSLNTLRHAMRPSAASSTTATSTTPLNELWEQMTLAETNAAANCRAVLNKWSQRTSALAQTASIQTKNRLTNASGSQPTIVDILQTQHLAPNNVDRLVERSRSKRSKAATADGDSFDETMLYDDADFYAQLLRDLIESRNEATAAPSTDATMAGSTQEALRIAQREARKRRPAVDTKASRGRKLRYAVHEKLQNFMAPEDRGSWGDRQRDELFAGLLGSSKTNGQVNGETSDREADLEDGYGDVHAEEEALRLFRQ